MPKLCVRWCCGPAADGTRPDAAPAPGRCPGVVCGRRPLARLALAGAALVSGSGGSRSPQPLPELLQGYDTTTQITALADWLRGQPGPSPRRVWIATDPDHTARAVVLARPPVVAAAGWCPSRWAASVRPAGV